MDRVGIVKTALVIMVAGMGGGISVSESNS